MLGLARRERNGWGASANRIAVRDGGPTLAEIRPAHGGHSNPATMAVLPIQKLRVVVGCDEGV